MSDSVFPSLSLYNSVKEAFFRENQRYLTVSRFQFIKIYLEHAKKVKGQLFKKSPSC